MDINGENPPLPEEKSSAEQIQQKLDNIPEEDKPFVEKCISEGKVEPKEARALSFAIQARRNISRLNSRSELIDNLANKVKGLPYKEEPSEFQVALASFEFKEKSKDARIINDVAFNNALEDFGLVYHSLEDEYLSNPDIEMPATDPSMPIELVGKYVQDYTIHQMDELRSKALLRYMKIMSLAQELVPLTITEVEKKISDSFKPLDIPTEVEED